MVAGSTNPSATPTVIADGLYRIDTPLGERYASLYLVVGSREVLLFDTGVDGTIPAYVTPAINGLGIDARDVRTVVISHCDVDHFGGVSDAREAFPRARLLAHRLDRPAIENFDIYVRERGRGFLPGYGWDEDPAVLDWCRSVVRERALDGDASDLQIVNLGGFEVVIWHIPGHTLGHTAISLPHAGAVLVSDAVLGASVDLADGTPAFPPTYRYVDAYLATIARLEAAAHRYLLTAHYPSLEGSSAAEFLARSRLFAERLDALVLSALADAPGGRTLHELLAELNPVAGDWPVAGTQGALAFPVVGHIERFRDSGRVRQAGTRDGIPIWAAA